MYVNNRAEKQINQEIQKRKAIEELVLLQYIINKNILPKTAKISMDI